MSFDTGRNCIKYSDNQRRVNCELITQLTEYFALESSIRSGNLIWPDTQVRLTPIFQKEVLNTF